MKMWSDLFDEDTGPELRSDSAKVKADIPVEFRNKARKYKA
jgi:hypothetical protein